MSEQYVYNIEFPISIMGTCEVLRDDPNLEIDEVIETITREELLDWDMWELHYSDVHRGYDNAVDYQDVKVFDENYEEVC